MKNFFFQRVLSTLANKQWIHRSEENLCSENSSQWNWEIHCIYEYYKKRIFSRKTLAKPFISVVFLAFLNVFLLLFGLDLVIRQLMTWFLKRDFLETNFLKSDFLKMNDFHISNWVFFIICWNTEIMFQLGPIKTIKIVFFPFCKFTAFIAVIAVILKFPSLHRSEKKVQWISQYR